VDGWIGYGLDGNLCVGLFYEHSFAMLIIIVQQEEDIFSGE